MSNNLHDNSESTLALINEYASTWRLLLEYDEDTLARPTHCQPSHGVLDYTIAHAAIAYFKHELIQRSEATPLFGNERDDALRGILGSIEQTMFGDSLYCTREEKAAHLLYFVIKDHPFTDGNKRIGSFLFMLYLQQEDIAQSMTPQALTTLALLIAASDPAQKDLLIRLVVNLLA